MLRVLIYYGVLIFCSHGKALARVERVVGPASGISLDVCAPSFSVHVYHSAAWHTV